VEGARLLTGATDGIGLALARRWRGQHHRTLYHGRRSFSDLEGLGTSEQRLFDSGSYIQVDLADPAALERFPLALNERGIEGLSLLVLNAGMGWWGRPAEQSGESIGEVVQVNLLAAMRLCHLLLPRLEKVHGRIVYISSVAAFLPCPDFAVYAAAKAAADGFFRSLRVELEGEVEVQVIRPGAVRTEMHRKCGIPPGQIATQRFPTPEAIAQRIDKLLHGPPVWRVLGAGNKAIGALGRNLPRLVERLQAKRGLAERGPGE